MNQLELHNRIDQIVADGPEATSTDEVRAVVNTNYDSRRYFYHARADEKWFDWLRDNGFFDTIKQKGEDLTQIRYKTPELEYLERMAEKEPKKVVDFMLTYDAKSNPNLETIDRFLWVCTKLPAEELARVAVKMRDDEWMKVIGKFNRWTFGYKEMFETLKNDDGASLALAEAVLSVRGADEVERTSFGSVENPFRLTDLHYSGVFERLANIGKSSAERALVVAAKTLKEVISLGEREDGVFDIGDTFPLFDVDFFELEVGSERHHYSSRDDVRDLAAVVKTLSQKLIGGSCDNQAEARRIHDNYIEPLPSARSMWRLRLFVWSLCPQVFMDELEHAFFQLFESKEHHYSIARGPEYKHALKIGFHTLSDARRREYVQKILETFKQKDDAPYGYRILSSIPSELLTDDEKTKAREAYGRVLDASYIPEPTIHGSEFGSVESRPPKDSENLWTKPISDIVAQLKRWTPEELEKTDTEQNFHQPVNMRGVGDKLRAKIKERLPEYVANASLFFDRDNLDPHYTYEYFYGLYEAVRANYATARMIDWAPFVAVSRVIAESGITDPFPQKRDEEDKFEWEASWVSVHTAIGDALKVLLSEEEEKTAVDFPKHRNDLLFCVQYLLQQPQPGPADETGDKAILQVQESADKYQASDPYSIAINSTRGRAFEAFLQFVFQDGKHRKRTGQPVLAEDVKRTYVDTLEREKTLSILFMFGHYLAFFYFRDLDDTDATWMKEDVFPRLFTNDTTQKDPLLAVWEGYLTTNLYKNLFEELHDQYARAIEADSTSYPKRKYHQDLDEALATHIALAYVHFKEFGFDSDLFKLFWSKPNTKRQAAFISFIGRHTISRDNPTQWLKENDVNVKKLEALWDYILEHCDDKEALQEFGFWMNVEKGVLDPAWLVDRIDRTLKKSGGNVKWEIKLMDSMPALAETNPEKMLSILRNFLLEGTILKRGPGFVRTDVDFMETFKILYAKLPDETHLLVNELLPINSGQFWILKEILK